MEINDHLEQEWKNYKTKSLFKSPIILGGTAFALAFIAYMKFTEPTAVVSESAPTPLAQQVSPEIVKRIEQKRAQEREAQEAKAQSQKIEKSKTEEPPKSEKDSDVLEEKAIVIQRPLGKQESESLKEKKVIKLEPNLSYEEGMIFKEEKSTLSKEETPAPEEEIFVFRQNSSKEELIRSFNQEESFSKALLIAKKYFDEEDYNNAMQWSLKANALDSENEESWIIFAKSNIAIGKIEIALKAIDAYLVNSNSEELKKIKEDVFK